MPKFECSHVVHNAGLHSGLVSVGEGSAAKEGGHTDKEKGSDYWHFEIPLLVMVCVDGEMMMQHKLRNESVQNDSVIEELDLARRIGHMQTILLKELTCFWPK